jgi:hypothetical protein
MIIRKLKMGYIHPSFERSKKEAQMHSNLINALDPDILI